MIMVYVNTDCIKTPDEFTQVSDVITEIAIDINRLIAPSDMALLWQVLHDLHT